MAEEQMSLDGILSGEKPAPREPAPEAPAKEPVTEAPAPKEPVERPQSSRKAWEDKEQEAQGRVRDPATGQFVAKTEAEPAPKKEPEKPAAEPAKPAPAAAPQQEYTDKEKAFLRGMHEERGKRQELERRLAAIESSKTQPGAHTEPAKTFWDDPEGAFAKHDQKVEQAVMNTRLHTAEMIARSRHTDFDEKVAVFRDFMAKAQGPQQAALAAQWLSSPDPAEYAYSFGKNQTEFQQVGNLDALRAKIEKETETKVRVQIEAELKAKAEALAKERAALPGSLSDARSVGTNKPIWGGPTSLENILKN